MCHLPAYPCLCTTEDHTPSSTYGTKPTILAVMQHVATAVPPSSRPDLVCQVLKRLAVFGSDGPLSSCVRAIVEAEEATAKKNAAHSASYSRNYYGHGGSSGSTTARKDVYSLLLEHGSDAMVLRFVKCLKLPELVSLTGTEGACTTVEHGAVILAH